ncbi:MAG: alpha/beta hydrolase fold domain-containing protein [Acidimicrobiaceae bacterium]|nr:alpha/beta hydrolase fold domain-containing protein [Acidimicrobiaceae bacterium]MDE0678463.1 alpha/beta hydrolase fold domain-containing protein [Acidimicrobiaceae bacterium]
MNTTEVHRPGRLGDPDMTLGTDPRADPRMVAVLAAVGLDGHGEPATATADSSMEELYAWVDEAEPGFEMLFDALFADLTPPDGVVASTVVISGVDDNDITLFIHRPAEADGPLPCVYHIHGGGMVLLSAAGMSYVAWRNELASRGLVAVGVEFRNGGGKLGNHPFPAGLNDCASGLQWVAANKADLGVSTITVSGESGGGNLTLATTLKAKREGYLDIIDGVFAQCPYISGAYADPPADLPSLHENNQYFLDCENMGGIAKAYDLGGPDRTNPLAWPLHATADDLAGLPPHVISVNELDPLRDEGLAYYRKLLAAGNSAQARTVNGTCHAGDVIFRTAMPEVYAASAAALRDFAYSV